MGANLWHQEQDHSLFSHANSQRVEPSRDLLGLRSLASTDFSSSSSSSGSNQMWPHRSNDPNVFNYSNSNAVASRVYSPWSVPPWLDVTQFRSSGSQQQSAMNSSAGARDVQGVQGVQNLWNNRQSPDPSQRNSSANESWPPYSQF